MITVMGATGHTGKNIAAALLKGGEQIRALGGSESKLAELKRSGAEVFTGDAADATFLTQTFGGRMPSIRCFRPIGARPTTAPSRIGKARRSSKPSATAASDTSSR